jgi:hypothetical protein
MIDKATEVWRPEAPERGERTSPSKSSPSGSRRSRRPTPALRRDCAGDDGPADRDPRIDLAASRLGAWHAQPQSARSPADEEAAADCRAGRGDAEGCCARPTRARRATTSLSAAARRSPTSRRRSRPRPSDRGSTSRPTRCGIRALSGRRARNANGRAGAVHGPR